MRSAASSSSSNPRIKAMAVRVLAGGRAHGSMAPPPPRTPPVPMTT